MAMSRLVYVMGVVRTTTNLSPLTLTGLLRQLGLPMNVLLEAAEAAF